MNPTAALLLSFVSAPAPSDLTPAALATRPRAVALADVPYDWASQSRGPVGKAADTTIVRTCCTETSIAGQTDQVPDYGFD